MPGSPPFSAIARKVEYVSVALAAANLVMFAQLTMAEFSRPDPIRMQNVRVLSRKGDTFLMDVNNPAALRRDQFSVRFCTEVTPEIQPGVTLTLLQYREDLHNRCFEVDRPDEGYTLLRRNNEPVLTAFDR